METQSAIVSTNEFELLRQVLSDGVGRLFHAGIETAGLDAEVILGHVLSMTREQLLASPDLPLRAAQTRQYRSLLSRRLAREPVAYITRRQEFWSLDFRVPPVVLVPRPETERLVETALALAREWPRAGALRILDIGTGSGAIAISLAKELPSSVVWATEISREALEIAQSNAVRNGVADRIHFSLGDLFAALGEAPRRFDLIVSNPPYIRAAEIDTLEPEVSLWEPRLALDGGVDGLDFYRRIARDARDYLAARGTIALEIGADAGKEIVKIFSELGNYAGLKIIQDYAGRERVVVARRHGQSAKST
jgi:release factor glutamine methyltransferase